MAKFYVICGSHALVISAPSASFAAMRLMDEVLAAHIWIYDDAGLSERNRRDHLALEALLHLSPTVKVSERGLGRSDVDEIGVPELLDQWHRLMTGLSRLTSHLELSERAVFTQPSDSAERTDKQL